MDLFVEKNKTHVSIIERLDRIEDAVRTITGSKQPFVDTWIDNNDLSNHLRVSMRTLQKWRDEGIISFTKFGGKIFYKASHVEEILRKNYIEGFRLADNG
jgi:hypothetical protein